jgi:tetratricopeptide (TPR) repeat protein
VIEQAFVKPLTGTIDQALWNASRLLLKEPASALVQAEEILHAFPTNIDALLLAARAHRGCGAPDRAEQAAHAVLALSSGHHGAMRELALISLMRGDAAGATGYLKGAIAANTKDAAAWSVLGNIRQLTGDLEGAETATKTSISVAVHDKECLAPALALNEERLSDAEQLLRLRLNDYPTDVTAIRMMAELATRLGRFGDAEKLLRRALQIAPYFQGARELLARNLQRTNRPEDALVEADILLSGDPSNPSLQMLKASLLVKTGDQDAARALYEEVLARHPKQSKTWMSLGHVLKALGHGEKAIAAYRRAIQECHTLGEAWWSLANLKTFRFAPEEVAAMGDALRQCSNDDDRLHLHFALGKACEDACDYEAAFGHWTEGNGLRRKTLSYDADDMHQNVRCAKAFFGAAMLEPKSGHPAGDPIFVVGMPRAGSTLVEQILASHSQIEGTMELPDMMDIAARLSAQARKSGQIYPEMLAAMTDEERHALGEEYLRRTRVHRKTDRPYFIDKMPNNWAHVGLIHMILPNARIIDARRHPIGCCLSMWKQHFARGQEFSYGFQDLARYYQDYAMLMAHFDAVAPGLVHRVLYERMVSGTEAEVRSLLAFLDLPFEDACLAFWRNKRAVRTASSEQVRQPIFSDSVDQWRHFEPWLKPWLSELAPLVAAHEGAVAV